MNDDLIILSLPAKPEYVMITRLTGAAIATRIGFDIDQIEDIKMAVAEALIMLINQLTKPDMLSVKFKIEKNRINIEILGEGRWTDKGISDSELGQIQLSKYIISSMMDGIECKSDKDIIRAICMHKDVGV